MIEGKLIAVRLQGKQLQRLNELSDETGLSHSEIVRLLIDKSKTVSEKTTISTIAVGAIAPKEGALAVA